MKVLKNFLLGTCVLSMITDSTSVFAQEINTNIELLQFTATLDSGEVIELELVRENNKLKSVPAGGPVEITNGETAYFINKSTGRPFDLMGGTYITFNISHNHPCIFEYGLVDERNNLVTKKYPHKATGTGTAIMSTDKILVPDTDSELFKLYIKNRSVDILKISNITATTSAY